MSSAKNSNVTPQDVAAKAAEEKLVVPAQAEEPKTGDAQADPKSDGTPELEVIEGGKKSLKERLAELKAKKLHTNKKIVLSVAATIGVATLAFIKYAKRKAEESLVEDESGDDQLKTDDSAA